jgi:DNA-binding NtrC family response regulator
MSLKEIRTMREIEDMTEAMRKTKGNVEAALRELKWSKSTFYRRVKNMGMTVPEFRKRLLASKSANRELSFL